MERDWVNASEIGEYAFCGRKYWLAEVRQVLPDAQASEALREGVVQHARHGRTVRSGKRLRRVSQIAAALAAIGLLSFAVWCFG